MMKKAILRGLLGVPLGIAIGQVIVIIISIAIGDGYYVGAVPELIAEFGGQLNAVIFQTVLYGVLGGVFAGASVIWEMERWSIVRQTGTYFLLTAVTMLPIAYFGHWMERTLTGFLIYFAVFIGIFIFNWLLQYVIWRNRVKGMNRRIKEKR